MAEYKSNVALINHDINLVYSKLSNPESLKSMADLIPDDAKGKIDNVTFGEDSISFKANPIGEIKLQAIEKVKPEKIVYSATSSPIPFKISLCLKDNGNGTTQGYAIIDIDIPVFLKPMAQGPLNQACEKFGELLAIIPYDKL